MKNRYQVTLRFMLGVALLGLVLGTSVGLVMGVGSASAQETPAQKKAKTALIMKGAELWPMYCNQCHIARPGSQFSPAQWDTIIMHMRSTANIPSDDAAAILEYLKMK